MQRVLVFRAYRHREGEAIAFRQQRRTSDTAGCCLIRFQATGHAEAFKAGTVYACSRQRLWRMNRVAPL